ncbi:MAG: lipopolysaccharide kinase InaA family protein [Longimicrobiales bacterium]
MFHEGPVLLVARERDSAFVRGMVTRHGTLAAHAAENARHVLAGRTRTNVCEGPGGLWVVRHAVRGGAFRKLFVDRYVRIGVPRPIRELRASARARALGIDTPEVLACAVYEDGLFYRADLATRFVDGSTDLARLSFGPDPPAEPVRAEAWRSAGRLLAATFAAGLIHADLNIKNIVVTTINGAGRAHLLDLDRCHFTPKLAPSARRAMLDRMERSIRKFERRTGRQLGPAERAAFADGLRG